MPKPSLGSAPVGPTKRYILTGVGRSLVYPVGHFLLAALPVLGYLAVRDGDGPTPALVGVTAVGSQFPDFIDKPLAYELDLLPTGRVFMHSLPFAIPLSLAVLWYGWKTDRARASGVFVFAYFSHLFGDNVQLLLGPGARVPPDLLWPFVEPIQRPEIPGWAGPGSVVVHAWTAISVAMVLGLAGFAVLDVRRQYRDRRGH